MNGLRLEKIELFEGLNLESLSLQLSKLEFRVLKYEKDSYLAFRGQKIEGIYINMSGIVATEMLRKNGESKKIEELKTGKVLAAAFIFGENNYFPVDIIAKTEVEILYIEKKEFLKLLIGDEKLLSKFLNLISNKAQFLSKNLWDSVSKKSIEEKIAEYFLQNQKNSIVELNMKINELADYFNVTRPSLSRVIKQLTEENIISKVKNGVYKIENINYLKSF